MVFLIQIPNMSRIEKVSKKWFEKAKGRKLKGES